MIYTKNIPVLFRVLLLLVFLFGTAGNAQSIAIDTEDAGVPLGGTGTYYLDMSSPSFADFRWEIYPYDAGEFIGGTPNNQATNVQITWKKPGTHQIKVAYYSSAYGQQQLSYNIFVSESADMTDAITIVSNCKSVVLERKDPPAGMTYYWQSTADGASTGNSAKIITVNSGTEYFLRAKVDSNNIWSATSGSIQYQINPNAYQTWYLDADGDGLGNPNYYVKQCSDPSTGSINYVLNGNDTSDGEINFAEDDSSPVLDNEFHWTQEILYDVNGDITGVSKTYFDDLGKPDVSVFRDMVSGKIWGTETGYDNFGRPEKSSFLAPSNLLTLNKVSFLNPDYHTNQSSNPAIPANRTVGAVTTSQTIEVSDTLTATGAVSPGLNVSFKGSTIVLGNGFSVSGASGGVFTATAQTSTGNNATANGPFFSYYSDSNTLEPYQATASQAYTQTNYDTLNPGNVINVVGGNKINGEWRTGYSYTVPAAQEMYYVYGADYYDGVITANGEEVITKFYKSVSVDANGVENVAFTDGEGKVLASARSGGTASYPVVSLIGTQGFVDVHIPAGINSSQVALIGSASLYKVYDLKTGAIASTPLTGGNAYRIEAITPPAADPYTYISAGVPIYQSGALGITYNVNYYDYAVNIYNKTGQLIKSIQPNGYAANTTILTAPAHMNSDNFATTFKYDALGQLIETTSPDQGTSRFAYRSDGQIRYSQSALQADTKVSYTDYDTLGRPIESGVIANNWATASANPDNPLIAGTRSEQTFTVYDHPENNTTSVALPTNLTLSAVLATAGISSSSYTQNNLSGNVAITYTKPGADITAITWYSYDIYGRAEWIVQYNEGIGAKTIHYQYDLKGNVKKVLFQKDKTAELFVHRYSYNANNALTKVETSIDNASFTTHADYSYYLTGELKRTNIAQGTQGLDYVYTLGGQLKSINHPSLEAAKDPGGDSNDVFGLALDYYNGDYLRTGKNIASSPSIGTDYNGNIKAARWANKGAGDYSGSTANQKGYLYNYDRNNWLTGAAFGNTNSASAAITPTGTLNEGGLSYDANGNIKTLQRTNAGGTLTDNLVYNYTNTGKNQLNSVTENAAATTADNTDIENQAAGNYQYDAIGQLTQNVSENLYYFYNTQGLVIQINKGNNPVVKFFYNERGQRIKKESYNTATSALQSTTFYVLDLSGNAMAVYDKPVSGSVAQTDLSIYGLSRLGVYKRASAVSSYEITDHLGNVRAVIEKENNSPAIKSFADYYPFGELLPSRNSLNYRYAFQGQELDGETGMEAFQLRLWDGRLGRWLSPDPYGQYSSPYLGMGNNPVSMIDPDGGFAEGPGDDPPVKTTPTELNEVIVYSKPKSFKFDINMSFNPNLNKSQFSFDESWKRIKFRNPNIPTKTKWLSSPVGDARISSLFMASRDCKECSKTHGGTDYAVAENTPIKATADGEAVRVYRSSTYGNAVILSHGTTNDGTTIYTLYAHGNLHKIRQGERVTTGQTILLSGNTGNSTGPHLHYEVIKTSASPFTPNFFGNLNVRYGPTELGNLLNN